MPTGLLKAEAGEKVRWVAEAALEAGRPEEEEVALEDLSVAAAL
jgi:hypothetical protein